MKTERLKKALEKAGIKVEMSQRECYDHITKQYEKCSPVYYAENNRNKIHWYDQQREVVCCQIMGKKENNDSQSDYFPGFFARSIKMAIAGMGF
jgi:hypothetical protein